MKHICRGAVALVFFGAVAASTAPGCVQAEAPFFIRSVKAPACEEVTTSSSVLPYGRLDVRYKCEYHAILELGNQLVRRGDETKLQVETSRISVTAVDVQILDAGEQPLTNAAGAAEFTYATTGFIDPASGTEPGYGLADALLVDGATGQALAASIPPGGKTSIIARVTAHGRTLGGEELLSRPYDFPLEVSNGGLCTEPSDDSCTNPTDAPKATCYIPQDFLFDCRFLGGHSCSDPATCGVFK